MDWREQRDHQAEFRNLQYERQRSGDGGTDGDGCCDCLLLIGLLLALVDRITGIFTGNRELTGLLPAVDLLGVDTDAAALRAGLKLMFGQPRPATGDYGR
jgi:hypothetical protein